MNIKLAEIAKEEATKNYHGYVCGTEANIQPVVSSFPPWNMRKWDGHWGAAFVYYCCRKAEFNLPVRYPDARVNCNFAGCVAWEQWSMLDDVNRWVFYDKEVVCEPGDIAIFDSVTEGVIHERIGIVLEDRGNVILVAEGNFNNVSALVERTKDNHIRGYIKMDVPEDDK